MSYDIGYANSSQIIKGFYNRPGFRFHAYQLKEEDDLSAVKLVIWRGNELIEPVIITSDQLVESTKSDKGYLELELYIEKQLRAKLQVPG